MNLGKLRKIENLRSIWEHEALDFTRWLAEIDNIQLLSEEIGVNIRVLQTEAAVGSFSVDILAEEVETGKKIIIENQLEKTDHDHLGKIITYAAGHEAEYIIWIVKEFKPEHQQALDWLNEHTSERINFFGIHIELWQIGSSEVAPKFNIISKPNEWTKAIRTGNVSTQELSQNSKMLLSFLDKFISYCKENQTTLSLPNPYPKTPSYYMIGIKTSIGYLAIKLNNSQQVVKVEFFFKEKEKYNRLKELFEKESNNEFLKQLTWDDLPNYKGANVGFAGFLNAEDESTWAETFKFIKDKAELIQAKLPQILNKL
jgi:hypothetical protein